MKLQEFFDRQKQTSFTDIDKLDLYQNILYKQTRKSATKRMSFIQAKYFVYTTIFVILLFGVYGVYFMNDGNIQENKRFSIRSSQTHTVQADYIGEVIEAKGNFFIEHSGILTKTNSISNGDTILLKEEAQLVFEIDNGTQSKIIGPAKLIVQKTENDNYKLNLVYGNFIHMEGKENIQQSIEVAINDITIKQEDRTQPINFKFIKEGEQQILQNNGANIILTKNNGEEKSTTLSKEQVLRIEKNDIKVFANIESFSEAIKTNTVSQTFALSDTNNKKTNEEVNQEEEIISLLNTLSINTTTTKNTEEITKEMSSLLTNEKKVLDPDKDEYINILLSSSVYTPEINQLHNTWKEGHIENFSNAYNTLERRIQNLYSAFGLSYTKTGNEPQEKIQGLIDSIKKLREHITTTYTLSPKYNEQLIQINKSLTQIISEERGTVKNETSKEIETTK